MTKRRSYEYGDAYNTFLQRNSEIRINNLQRLYSKLASKSTFEQEQTVNEIRTSYNLGASNADPLATLRTIKIVMVTDCKSEFLIPVNTKSKPQNWLPLVGAQIPFVIVLLQFISTWLSSAK